MADGLVYVYILKIDPDGTASVPVYSKWLLLVSTCSELNVFVQHITTKIFFVSAGGRSLPRLGQLVLL